MGGFAVPIDRVVQALPGVLAGRRPVLACLGCRLRVLNHATAVAVNADPNFGVVVADVDGVLVEELLPGAPAEKAGMHKGDVVVDVSGSPCKSVEAIQRRVRQTKPGEELAIKVRRGANGQAHVISVKAGEVQEVLESVRKLLRKKRVAQPRMRTIVIG